MNSPRRTAGRPKPVGQPTRGKTAPNRLRRVDLFVVLALEWLVRAPGALLVDVGFGAEPVTTLETFTRLRRLNPALRVIGVEIDADRVAEAAAHSRPGLEVRQGGFNLPLAPGEAPRIIRALNVLRQYEETDVRGALALLGTPLALGGALLEGTSDPSGRLLVFNVLQRRQIELVHRWLVLSTNFRQPFHPADWRAVLPKAHIHRAGEGDVMGRFFAAYARAFQVARSGGQLGDRALFAASAKHLREDAGYPVRLHKRLLQRGFLVVDCPAEAAWSLAPLSLPPASAPPR